MNPMGSVSPIPCESHSKIFSPNKSNDEQVLECTADKLSSFVPEQSCSDMFDLSDTFQSLSLEEQESAPSELKTVQEKNVIFESCLDSLIMKVKCQHASDCPSTVRTFRKTFEGSSCRITAKCWIGHKFDVVETQPKIKNFYAGNLLIAASILFSGLNYQKINEFCNILGLVGISQTTYYKFLFPAIDLAWYREKESVKNELLLKALCVAGDGQCDSPGHSAKYCVYTVMDTVTDKILDFEVVQRSQFSSSTAMEKHGFGVMDRLLETGFKIKIFASDRHVGIRRQMRTDYANVNHQFDVRHYAKSIKKKLTAASHVKLCREITLWIDKIGLHTCKRKPELLREKWLSLLEHISDNHEWEGELYTKCSHGTLDDSRKDILWLRKETPPYQNIQKIVNSKQFEKKLPHLMHNCHTGQLENFQSLVTKYRTKRIHFGIDGMEARIKLAVLTHNHNVGRQQAVVNVPQKNKDPKGTKRTRLVIPKGKSRWIVRDVYEKINVDYLEGICVNVVQTVKARPRRERDQRRNEEKVRTSLFPVAYMFTSRPGAEFYKLFLRIYWRESFQLLDSQMNIQDMALEVVKRSPRGGDLDKILMQHEMRWIFRMGTMKPKGLNEQLSFHSFL
ncbi:LOW QUALITY PROTEIN: uncharacterized protein RB166_019205 [Leptodactylus fuscus]